MADSIVDVLERRSIEQPDALAFIYLEDGKKVAHQLTYSQLYTKASKAATRLESFCAAGDRAVLCYPPGIEFVIAFFACLISNIIAVPVAMPRAGKPNEATDKFCKILQDAQPQVIAGTTDTIATVKLVLANNSQIDAVSHLETDRDFTPIPLSKQPRPTAQSIAYLQYTSGSTAEAKGVMITHLNLMSNMLAIEKMAAVGHDSIGLTWLPAYHDLGLVTGILQPVYNGYRAIIMSHYDFLQHPIRWLKAISTHRVTHSGGPNFAYDLCVNRIRDTDIENMDLSCWKVAFNGAEIVRDRTLNDFSKRFSPQGFAPQSFMACYGLAEIVAGATWSAVGEGVTGFTLSKSALDEGKAVIATAEEQSVYKISCGTPGCFSELLIVNPESGLPCDEQVIGEIWLNSPSVAQGYWQCESESRKTFTCTTLSGTELTYLRTGDLGFMLDGQLCVVGRIKELIIIDGKNYYPADLEAVISHFPELQPNGSAAFAVDTDGGEILIMVTEVVRAHVKTLDTAELSRLVTREVTQRIGIRPKQVIMVKQATLPRTTSGKIRRLECATRYKNGSLSALN